jgi:regulator of sigma E protease
MLNSLFAFIVVLGVLIFFHELGHFLVARLFGVGVEKFSLGFGPRLIGKKIGITDYRLSAIPLGGYVKMIGEDPDAQVDEVDIHLSFTHKHVFKRICIVAAGPIFNLLLAIVIFFGIFLTSGMQIWKASISAVSAVSQGAPAHTAGLKDGDLIVAIDGHPIDSWGDMTKIINGSQGKSLTISVQRDGTARDFSVTPEQVATKNLLGEDIQRYMIGVTFSGETFTRELDPFQAFIESFVQTYRVTELMVVIIGKLITGGISADMLGGPIMIAKMAGDQAEAGIGYLISFIALISINLAIINLLPIPILDGGHLMFFIIEAIKKRPVSIKVREIAQQIGLFMIILLIIFVFYNDISKWVRGVL